MAELDENTDAALRKHLFAINAVSGAAVGAVGYVGHIGLKTDSEDALRSSLIKFTGWDALSPALAAMLYPDLLARFLPLPLRDCAAALELAWERGWDESCSEVPPPPEVCEGALGKDVLEFSGAKVSEVAVTKDDKDDPWLPILIVQGAGPESGERILTSRVKFARSEINANNFHELFNGDYIVTSTAIHNGARFPYASPAGVIPNNEKKIHIVGGGYFDATGVETVRELGQAIPKLEAWKDYGGAQIVYLIIRYDKEPAKRRGFAPPNEIVGPLLALFFSRNGHSDHVNKQLVAQAGSSVFRPVLRDCIREDKVVFRVPMNWVISREISDYISNFANGESPEDCAPGKGAEEIGRLARLINSGAKPPK